MCGILGKIATSGKLQTDRSALESALGLQFHRGPDFGSTYVDDKIAFAHRRLSIIDLSNTANQPMVSDDGAWILVFNGEIYNFAEIRSKLEAKGHSFRTHSDTEVLLLAFREFGAACVQEFIGMFAFAIHNKLSTETYLFRDRLGIKPLYFYRTTDYLAFSSEIKSLLRLCSPKRSLNVAAASSYLSYRYPILDDSFFEGIESLPPGCFLRISAGKVSQHRYWNPCEKFSEQQYDRGEAYYRETLRELLESAVRYRLIADVPTGAYLSGGIDSSIVVAEMAALSDRPVKSFTVGFDEDEYNEFDYANLVASKFGTEHRQIHLSSEKYLDTMLKLIAFKDGPLSVPNEVPLYLLSKELKKHITVVLSGEGADELFGGYGRIFRAPIDYARYQQKAESGLSPEEWAIFERNFVSRYGIGPFGDDVDHFLQIYRYTGVEEKRRWLNQDLRLDECEHRQTEKFRNVFSEVPGESYFNRMTWALIRIHVVGLLHRVDITTMASSVEARVPFLDHRLVEFALTIPEKYKVKWKGEKEKHSARTLTAEQVSEIYDTPKYILKRAYEDTIPKEVLYRRKMGFPVPLDKWFGSSLRDFASDTLLSHSARQRGIYNVKEIRKVLSGIQLEEQHHLALKIWMLVNLELFCQQYLDREIYSA
ncbi:asparagine synthase (glutamine-hydrolyzing) [Pseudomonadota bacterium]